MSAVQCPECGQNNFQPLESDDGSSIDAYMCSDCGHELAYDIYMAQQKYTHYKVGLVRSVTALPGKDKLSAVELIIGHNQAGEDDRLSVVTNAKYVRENDVCVVAMIGAVVPAGADLNTDVNAFVVKKSTVGGRVSNGVLCDAAMLGWSRGTKGQLAILPGDKYAPGTLPPLTNPN